MGSGLGLWVLFTEGFEVNINPILGPVASEFLVTSINYVTRIKLTQESALLTHLRYFNVSSCIVSEEQILILCVFLNPGASLFVFEKIEVGGGLEVLALVAEEHLLEVGVVEHVGVHSPPSHSGLVLFSGEPKGV